MKKVGLSITEYQLIFIIISIAFAPLTYIQQDGSTLTLSIRRDWGYGGFNGEIQGTFSLRVSGPEDLTRVDYFMDESPMASVDTAPFSFQFHTDNLPPGTHIFSAAGFLSDGSEVQSNQISRTIVTSEVAGEFTRGIIAPILTIVFIAVLLSAVLPLLTGRRGGTFMVGQYGIAGGAVCPRCALPYSRHYLSMNLFTGKLERCPHCAKWAVVRRASAADWRAAEARYREQEGQGALEAKPDDSEGLRRQLDDSRYED